MLDTEIAELGGRANQAHEGLGFFMLRVALLGCGRIAVRHAELLGGEQVPGAALAAVCDVDMAKARRLGEQFKVPYFSDLDEMLNNIDCDVVSVLTESGLHASHTIAVAHHKRHVIVEKPMALRLDDADEMIRVCAENGVRLFVVKQNRFNVPVQKLREALDAGRFGKLVMGTVRVRWCRPQEYYDQDAWRGTWALDGGVLTNQASHHIDILEWMLGDVESVFGMSTTALVDIEAEDTAAVVLRFRNGALGLIEATTAVRPRDLEGSMSLIGEGGAVEIGGFALNELRSWSFVKPEPEDEDVRSRFSVNPPDVYGFGHKSYYEHVVDCLKTGREQLVDGLAGRKSLELIMAIYESIETGREVRLRFKPDQCRLGETT